MGRRVSIASLAIVAALGVLLAAGVGVGVFVYEQARVKAAERRTTAADKARAAAERRAADLEKRWNAKRSSARPVKSVTPTVSPSTGPTENAPAATFERRFAYIRKLERRAGRWYATVDYAEFLTGKAAAEAAARAGKESPPPNDFFVVNDNPRLRSFPIAPDAPVTLGRPVDPASLWVYTLSEFTKRWRDGDVIEPGMEPNFALRDGGYWLTVSDGVVREIVQQYVP